MASCWVQILSLKCSTHSGMRMDRRNNDDDDGNDDDNGMMMVMTTTMMMITLTMMVMVLVVVNVSWCCFRFIIVMTMTMMMMRRRRRRMGHGGWWILSKYIMIHCMWCCTLDVLWCNYIPNCVKTSRWLVASSHLKIMDKTKPTSCCGSYPSLSRRSSQMVDNDLTFHQFNQHHLQHIACITTRRWL